MADGREKLLIKNRHINSGIGCSLSNPGSLLQVYKRGIKCLKMTFLPKKHAEKTALNLRKPSPFNERGLPVFSIVASHQHRKCLHQNRVYGLYEEDNTLLNNSYGSRINTNYPPTYNCRETVYNLIYPYNTIITN